MLLVLLELLGLCTRMECLIAAASTIASEIELVLERREQIVVLFVVGDLVRDARVAGGRSRWIL